MVAHDFPKEFFSDVCSTALYIFERNNPSVLLRIVSIRVTGKQVSTFNKTVLRRISGLCAFLIECGLLFLLKKSKNDRDLFLYHQASAGLKCLLYFQNSFHGQYSCLFKFFVLYMLQRSITTVEAIAKVWQCFELLYCLWICSNSRIAYFTMCTSKKFPVIGKVPI